MKGDSCFYSIAQFYIQVLFVLKTTLISTRLFSSSWYIEDDAQAIIFGYIFGRGISIF